MNKQQLAAKIWQSANKMRSKIDANEYKDYILGFIFYKYLSDKEIRFAKKMDFSDEDIKALSEEDSETVEYIKSNIGYFIAYDDLFSTWIEKGKDFDISNVRDALSAFSRLISPAHKKIFDGIFDTLQTGLSKLGESSASQTKAARELIHLIKDIPMDGRQDFDVLGYIYEYLISMFAANAGKKAGEFYTPHEVSLLMSEIVAEHLKDRKEIQIYDPTSGSGSLLINIGSSVAKHIDDKDNIKYYAQELKQNTYNLTRMNLVMRDIIPSNIVTRNGDTLEDDWPYFNENDPVNTYDPLYVDAVVSNPPYSQSWDSANKENDPRYKRFGLAPKSKADYAFLLHDLYHLKPDGIMTIILPHGVLFRTGEEATIRENLIESNHIDTIIGLPSNIFYGTSISTIIMILKQKRDDNDVLFIDASKGFIKVGKNNMLRASDIKRAVDTVIERKSIPKYSKVISRDTIRDNEYNLNISRYVDSNENAENWDLYSSMFGGIPEKEIDDLYNYWQAFPQLRNALFTKTSSAYSKLKSEDIKRVITEHDNVRDFVQVFKKLFSNYQDFLKAELLRDIDKVPIPKERNILSLDLFKRLEIMTLIDRYEAYQLLDDEWVKIEIDLEIIQTESFDAVRKTEPNMVLRTKDGKEQEVQEGWIGRIMPFELVQEVYLETELQDLKQKQSRLIQITIELNEIIDSLTEEEKSTDILNEANDAFSKTEITKTLKTIYEDVDSEEIRALKNYWTILDNKAKKPEKTTYIEEHTCVEWNNMIPNKDSTYGKTAVNKYIAELQSLFTFPEDSYEDKIVQANNLLNEETELKKDVKEEASKLHLLTKETIENLSDEQAYELLEFKWITPLVTSLNNLPKLLINELTSKVQALAEKYEVTYAHIVEDIVQKEEILASFMDELKGNEFDLKALVEFKSILKTKKND